MGSPGRGNCTRDKLKIRILKMDSPGRGNCTRKKLKVGILKIGSPGRGNCTRKKLKVRILKMNPNIPPNLIPALFLHIRFGLEINLISGPLKLQ